MMQVAIEGRAMADDASRIQGALLFAAFFLALEPATRALLWWLMPGGGVRSQLHGSTVLLCLALAPLLLPATHAATRALLVRHPYLVALGLLWCIAAVCSTLAALDPGVATVRNVQWLILLTTALALLAGLRSRPERGADLLLAWAAGFLAYAVVIAAFYAVHHDLTGYDWINGLPGIHNVRHLGFEAMAAALIGTMLRLDGRPGANRLLRAAGVAGWAVLLWSGSRGSFLSAVAALALVAVVLPRSDLRRRAGEAGAMIAAGLLIAMLAPVAHDSFGLWRTLGATTVGADTVDQASSGRLGIWREAMSYIVANPLFGIGEGQMTQRLVTSAGVYAQPHNVLLQAPLFWGVPGGAAFLAAVAFVLARAIARVRRSADPASVAAAGFAVALALAGNALIDGTLFHPRPAVLFLVAACLALAAPMVRKG